MIRGRSFRNRSTEWFSVLRPSWSSHRFRTPRNLAERNTKPTAVNFMNMVVERVTPVDSLPTPDTPLLFLSPSPRTLWDLEMGHNL